MLPLSSSSSAWRMDDTQCPWKKVPSHGVYKDKDIIGLMDKPGFMKCINLSLLTIIVQSSLFYEAYVKYFNCLILYRYFDIILYCSFMQFSEENLCKY